VVTISKIHPSTKQAANLSSLVAVSSVVAGFINQHLSKEIKMQNAIATSASAVTYNAAAFSVLPFAEYQAYVPTIKLANIGCLSNVKLAEPVKTKKVTAKTKAATVEQVIAEGLELAKMHDKYCEEYVVRGNKALYEVLAAIYGYAMQINESASKDEIIKRMCKVLKDDYSIKTTTKTHWLTTVVKLIVKGTDRQTASNYSRILQVAFDENLAANELANYIERRGGVAKIRATEAASVAVNTAQDINKERGALVKEYLSKTALHHYATIECNAEPTYWVGDARKGNVESKHKTGQFNFFITVADSNNKYRVVEHGKFSEAFEEQIMRLIANTYNEGTDAFRAKLAKLTALNDELNKKPATGPTPAQFIKLFELA